VVGGGGVGNAGTQARRHADRDSVDVTGRATHAPLPSITITHPCWSAGRSRPACRHREAHWEAGGGGMVLQERQQPREASAGPGSCCVRMACRRRSTRAPQMRCRTQTHTFHRAHCLRVSHMAAHAGRSTRTRAQAAAGHTRSVGSSGAASGTPPAGHNKTAAQLQARPNVGVVTAGQPAQPHPLHRRLMRDQLDFADARHLRTQNAR
jgi:hypothetical protein